MRKNALTPSFVGSMPGQLLVLDEVVGEQIAEPVDVACVQQVIRTSHRGCVIHRCLLAR